MKKLNVIMILFVCALCLTGCPNDDNSSDSGDDRTVYEWVNDMHRAVLAVVLCVLINIRLKKVTEEPKITGVLQCKVR